MAYEKQFLDRSDLTVLINEVLANIRRINGNTIPLQQKNLAPVMDKIKNWFDQRGRTVNYYKSYFFLACGTTMRRRSAVDWHVDMACREIDGDCFNVWIPIYNTSTGVVLEIIEEERNPKVYESAGDPTLPLLVLTRELHPDQFHVPRAEGNDMKLVRQDGCMLMLSRDNLKVTRYGDAQVGDIAVFKQTELHRGVHSDGVRLQLSMKFVDGNARINQGSSNPYWFHVFKQTMGGDERACSSFVRFQTTFAPRRQALSKHGRLEQIMARELLQRQLAMI